MLMMKMNNSESSSLKATMSYKRLKMEIPEFVAKKPTERPLPHPFPFPANYRPEVEICLKSGRRQWSQEALFIICSFCDVLIQGA